MRKNTIFITREKSFVEVFITHTLDFRLVIEFYNLNPLSTVIKINRIHNISDALKKQINKKSTLKIKSIWMNHMNFSAKIN